MLVTIAPMFTKRNRPLKASPRDHHVVTGEQEKSGNETMRIVKPQDRGWNDPWKSVVTAGPLNAHVYTMPQYDATIAQTTAPVVPRAETSSWIQEAADFGIAGNPFVKTTVVTNAADFGLKKAGDYLISTYLPDTVLYGSAPKEVQDFVNNDNVKRVANAIYHGVELTGKTTRYFVAGVLPQLPEIKGKASPVPTVFKTVTKRAIGGLPEVAAKWVGSSILSALSAEGTSLSGLATAAGIATGHPVLGLAQGIGVSLLTNEDSGHVEYAGPLKWIPALVGSGEGVSVQSAAQEVWDSIMSDKETDRWAKAIVQAI